MAKTFDSALIASVTEKLASIGISESFINPDELDATMEVLRNLKKNNKAAAAEAEAAQKKVASAEAFAKGKAMLANAKVGDIVTVICGSGKFAKEYQFPIEKVGESTVTVEFTETNTPNGTTGKRYIKFDKVVSVNN